MKGLLTILVLATFLGCSTEKGPVDSGFGWDEEVSQEGIPEVPQEDEEITPDGNCEEMVDLGRGCEGRSWKCTDPKHFVRLMEEDCTEAGMEPCCLGKRCKEGEEEACGKLEVCTEEASGPCIKPPGKVVGGDRVLEFSVPEGEILIKGSAMAWYARGIKGEEAVVLAIDTDEHEFVYPVPGGVKTPLNLVVHMAKAGTLRITVASGYSPEGLDYVWLEDLSVSPFKEKDSWTLAGHVPYFQVDERHLKSDLPLAVYADETPASMEYTLYYTNEDGGYGGIPRLIMASWGRAVDIEWALTVRNVGPATEILYQKEDHGSGEFEGKFIGNHPVLRVANNHGTFSDKLKEGDPIVIPSLSSNEPIAPREAFLDRHPYLVKACELELEREGKVCTNRCKGLKIPPLYEFLYLDTWSEGDGDAKIELKVKVKGPSEECEETLSQGLGKMALLSPQEAKRVAIPILCFETGRLLFTLSARLVEGESATLSRIRAFLISQETFGPFGEKVWKGNAELGSEWTEIEQWTFDIPESTP